MLSQSQGLYSANALGIGPHIGYAIGNSSSVAFPYFDVGLRYYRMAENYDSYDDSNASGTDIFLGFGIITSIKPHLGLVIEAGYHMLDLKNKDYDVTASGNIFSIGIGIAGIIFSPHSLKEIHNF